jgi:TPR repeat protein
MNATAVVLLVTWLIPGQPPGKPQVVNSYQTSFDTADACEHARDNILEDARRINDEIKAKWADLGPLAATMTVSVSAVCSDYSGSQKYDGTRLQSMAYHGFRWALVAAESGDAEAQSDVGSDLAGADKDLQWISDTVEGLKWLDRSAQHGCFNAFLFLSMFYRNGVNNPSRPHGYIPRG